MDLGKLQAEAEELQARLEEKTKNRDAERLAEVQATIEAEQERLNSKAYKKALEAVDDLGKEADALKTEAVKAVFDALAIMDKWEAAVKKRRSICYEHRIEAKDLFNAENKVDKLVWIKGKIETWKRLKHLYEATYPNMAQPGKAKAVNKRGLFGLTEHEKMLKKRYPENK